MVKPNIFLVGVQKAGTTSLYHYLRKHSDIFGPEIKDYNNSHPFFTNEEYFQNNKADFEKLFSDNSTILNVITSEVEFIEDIEYLKRIKKYSPNAKIVVSLRNPIERLKSMYKFYNQIGSNPEGLNFEDALTQKSELYIQRSLYYNKIMNLYKVFDSNQIKIVYFEDITGNKFNSVIEELYKFIGVPYEDSPFIHENKTRLVKYSFVDRIMKFGRETRVRKFIVHNLLDNFFDANKRYRLKKKIREWNLSDQKLSSKSKEQMSVPSYVSEMLINDTKQLSQLINKDLITFWGL